MISINDCVLLLSDLEEQGLNVDAQLTKLSRAKELPLDVLKFINDKRQLDLSKFYEKLRKSYNNKKSNLYINIVKDIEDPNDVLTTLASLQLQILLYSKSVSDQQMFLKHARSREISMVLAKYFTNYDLTNCIKLLRIVKSDLKILEQFSKS